MSTHVVVRDYWARNVSPNANVKVFVGAPASSTAAGSGYVNISTLSDIAVAMRHSFPSFGGVMLWDASQAYGRLDFVSAPHCSFNKHLLVNNRYDLAIKNALVASGGTGFTYPACTSPAYVSGDTYTAGLQVSFNG